jgi:hypothetical protein
MKKILSVSLILCAAFASNIMPYGAYLKYSSKAYKDKGYLFGVYGNYSLNPYKIEFDAEHTVIKYKQFTELPDWKQTDFTLVGHFYQSDCYEYKAGIHNIWSKQTGDEYDKVYILGALYYQYLKYNTGVDFYYSDYKGFDVSQFSPKIGFDFGKYYSETGSFYAELKYNYIHVQNNAAPKSDYSNFDLKLQNFKGPWTTTLNVSMGKNAYKVEDNGFVVYNLGDEYKSSYGLKINYAVDKQDNIEIGCSRSKYNNGVSDAYSYIYTVSYSKAF